MGNSGTKHVLRVASGRQPISAPALCGTAPLSSPALCSGRGRQAAGSSPSSGMTGDGTVQGGQGRDTHFSVGPAPSAPARPLWAGGTASSALSDSLRPVCTGMCSDSLAFSRCGLLGKGSCVRTDTCALGVPGARPGWVGWAGGGSQMCLLDLEQAHGHAFDNNEKIFLFCPNFSARGVSGICVRPCPSLKSLRPSPLSSPSPGWLLMWVAALQGPGRNRP